jgi:hypothetical protein
MQRYARIVMLGLLTTLLALGAAWAAPGGKDQTYTGVVSDTMCGASHMGKDPAACTRACVQRGSDYALVVGEKVYTLKGDKDELYKLAGQKVTVKGKLTGDTIEATSISAATAKKG